VSYDLASIMAPQEQLHRFTTTGQEELNKLIIASTNNMFIRSNTTERSVTCSGRASSQYSVWGNSLSTWTSSKFSSHILKWTSSVHSSYFKKND